MNTVGFGFMMLNFHLKRKVKTQLFLMEMIKGHYNFTAAMILVQTLCNCVSYRAVIFSPPNACQHLHCLKGK